MDPLRSNPTFLGQRKKSVPTISVYAATISKNSKAENILGISRAELQTINLKPTPQVHGSGVSQPSQPSFQQFFARGRANQQRTLASSNDGIRDSDDSRQHENLGEASNSPSPSSAQRLNRQISTSTMRSVHRSAPAPMEISKQAPNPTRQDFVQQSEHMTIKPSKATGLGYSRALKFFKSSKPNGSDARPQINSHVATLPNKATPLSASRGSSVSAATGVSASITDISRLSGSTRTVSPELIASRAVSYERGPQETLTPRMGSNSQATTVGSSLHSPYAKVNVRRPKAGAKHWFDIVDEEDENSDLEEGQDSDHEVESVNKPREGANEIDTEASYSPRAGYTSPFKSSLPELHTKDARHTPISSKLAANSLPPAQELAATSNIIPVISKSPLPTIDSSRRTERRSHISSQLMSKHDEFGEHDLLPPLRLVGLSDLGPEIRESISVDIYGDSELEIGLAQAVEPTNKSGARKPSPIKVIGAGAQDDAPPRLSPLDFDGDETMLDSSSPVLERKLDGYDTTEEALLGSFPPTPTYLQSNRASVTSATSLSDDKSVSSMRMIKVTRQEEKLIAAMRSKRALAERTLLPTAKGNTKDGREFDEALLIPERQSSLSRHIAAQLKDFSVDPVSEKTKYSGLPAYSRSIGDDTRKAVTKPRTTLHKAVSMENTNLTRISENNYSYEQPGNWLSSRSTRLAPKTSAAYLSEQYQRPHSFRSSASEESRKRESNMIVLENLNSGLPNQIFPSQLYMESPFAMWERK